MVYYIMSKWCKHTKLQLQAVCFFYMVKLAVLVTNIPVAQYFWFLSVTKSSVILQLTWYEIKFYGFVNMEFFSGIYICPFFMWIS
jgi:hypothetical protein